jgi:hypothetical protein
MLGCSILAFAGMTLKDDRRRKRFHFTGIRPDADEP